ncbi:hypothetical protein SRABI106_04244 [Rahnella aquatilis]|nr:hypothetical protein SRABI106_04244 [Rahnella aquatilis]
MQTFQRGFYRFFNIARRQTDFTFAHRLTDFGGENDLVTLTGFFQPVADDGFGFSPFVAFNPARVHICRIDEIQFMIQQGIQQVKRGSLIDGPAKYIATKG